VLQDGEWFRILGRKSELINVGGEKVYPAEVESVIQSMGDVEEATVYGERNPLVGHIVCAKVRASVPVDPSEFAARVRRHCGERLERFKVPVKVEIVEEQQFGDRFKKIRR
jgi:long-chain acyl-CoA synthetase